MHFVCNDNFYFVIGTKLDGADNKDDGMVGDTRSWFSTQKNTNRQLI